MKFSSYSESLDARTLYDSDDEAFRNHPILKKSKFAAMCVKFFDDQTRDFEPATHLYIFRDDAKPGSHRRYSAVHDDGTLHLTHVRSGIRACFDVQHGQMLSCKETNENARAVLDALGVPECINERTLLDESDDEEEDDECCPHCGR